LNECKIAQKNCYNGPPNRTSTKNPIISIPFSFRKDDRTNIPVEIINITIKKYEVTRAMIGLDGLLKRMAPIEEAAIVVEKKNGCPSFSNSGQLIVMLLI
jgi:hypothetical protein